MRDKTFWGANLRDAMLAVQREFGPDAVIVSSRRAANGGEGFDVVARGGTRSSANGSGSRGASARKLGAQVSLGGSRPTPPSPAPPRQNGAKRLTGADPSRSVVLPTQGTAPHPAPVLLHGEGVTVEALTAQVSELRSVVQSVAEVARRSLDSAKTYTELRHDVEGLTRELSPRGAEVGLDDPEVRRFVAMGIEAPIARAVAYRARGKASPQGGGLAVAKPPDLIAELASAIPTAPALWARDERVVAALVGPPGVGKTASIAKIAWMAMREYGRRVAVVATDGHRMGRAESLRELAERLRIPVRLARSRYDLSAALAEFAERELVLIDTPGCPARDDSALFGQDALLDLASVERHAVIPATWRASEIQDLVRRYSRFHVASLILTKTDEARGWGAALTATWESHIPLSHVSSGPRVPDDIVAAVGRNVAERILVAA